MRRFLWDCLALTLFGLLVAVAMEGCRAWPAPAPFPRTSKVLPLSRAALVGAWNVHWGTVRCTFTLSANGDYVCLWPGARYVGTWRVHEGRLWVIESSRPESASSWQSYAIRLRLDTLSGPVEVGATGVVVRMERRRP